MMAGRCISVSHAALGSTRVMVTCGLQGQAVGTAAGFCRRHMASPRPAPPADMFAPANVIDGFARAIRGVPHSWRPDPKAKLPQWIELDFGKPVKFNCVHVSFQTKELRASYFRLEVPQGGDWKSVAEVAENSDRRRVLTFPAVTAAKLRLVLRQARPDVGVCEIRVYEQ